MKYILEAVEGSVAKLEKDDGSFINIDLTLLPENIKCGDVLLLENGKYTILQNESLERKEKLLSLQQRLFKKKN